MQNGEFFRRRNLPHWDVDGATYFVTCCLAGSVPARGRLSGRTKARSVPDFATNDECLDAGLGVRWLSDHRLAREVEAAIIHFAGTRYELLGYVVMPNHVHWVFRPLARIPDAGQDRSPRQAIMHSFCRHTARICNQLLRRTGPFWQRESYDRVVRSEEELVRIVDYVEGNPVKAGLCVTPHEWEFSSARRRIPGPEPAR